MKAFKKWMMVATLSSPILLSGSCVSGLREAVLEGGLGFVEESVVEVLGSFISLEDLLGGE